MAIYIQNVGRLQVSCDRPGGIAFNGRKSIFRRPTEAAGVVTRADKTVRVYGRRCLQYPDGCGWTFEFSIQLGRRIVLVVSMKRSSLTIVVGAVKQVASRPITPTGIGASCVGCKILVRTPIITGAAKDLLAFDIGQRRIRPIISDVATSIILGSIQTVIGEVSVNIALVVVLGILEQPQPNLLHIAQTRRAPRVFACSGKDRKQDRGQQCDYSHNDQEFYQGKRFANRQFASLGQSGGVAAGSPGE